MREISIASSTHIQSVVYDDDNQTLVVTFSRGAVYQYSGVDANTAEGFASAISPSQYFSAYIKGGFLYERLV